jgi:hypothetical protein
MHLRDGRRWDAEGAVWRNGKRRLFAKRQPPEAWNAALPTTRVVLACAHLDHDPTHNLGHNRVAACQRCHLETGREDNRALRRVTITRR